MATGTKTEYEVVVKVTVDSEEIGNYSGVKVTPESVVEAVRDALESHREQMGEAIAGTGAWNRDSEVIGSVMEFEVGEVE